MRLFPTILLASGFILSGVPRSTHAADSIRPEISFDIHKLKEENVEGPDVERTYLVAGGKRVVFGAAKGTHVTVSDSGMHINLSEIGLDGEIHVGRSPFTPEFELATQALQYRTEAAKGIANGASDIQVQQPVMDPYPFNGWKSLGFTWNYSFPGRAMVRTVSYVNLEVGVQIVVTTLSSKADAEKVAKAARGFMSSWWVMGS